jgi:hypothetical protein
MRRESKTSRKVLYPVKENGVWRIRNNEDVMDLNRAPDTVLEVTKGRLGLVRIRERAPDERNLKEMFKNIPEGKDPLESKKRDGWTMLKMI